MELPDSDLIKKRFSETLNATNALASEFEKIKHSNLLYLTDTMHEEIYKIDIKREQEINRIDKYYAKMIEEIREFEKVAKQNIEQMKFNFEPYSCAVEQLEKIRAKESDDRETLKIDHIYRIIKNQLTKQPS